MNVAAMHKAHKNPQDKTTKKLFVNGNIQKYVYKINIIDNGKC